MGSPISPAIANLVMESLESQVINNLAYQLPFYKRYVDVILTAVHPDNLDNIGHSFNLFHPNLRFTHEVEVNNKISFLDILLINNNGSILLDWYQKPPWSGRYLHYFSQDPETHKKCVVTGLIDRGLILSDPSLRAKNLNLITSTLIQNGYPPTSINSVKSSRVEKLYNSLAINKYNPFSGNME